MRRFTWITVMAMVMVLSAAVVLAQSSMDKKTTAPAKSTMHTYLIESPHTAEECMATMDETNKMKSLEKWEFGCMSGNHTGYRIVQAKDEAAALAMVPENVRAKATAHQVMTLTPAMLANAHKSHM